MSSNYQFGVVSGQLFHGSGLFYWNLPINHNFLFIGFGILDLEHKSSHFIKI